jgi:hypothetical protein
MIFAIAALSLAAQLVQPPPRADSLDQQLSSYAADIRVSETIDARAAAEPRMTEIRFFRRRIPDQSSGEVWGWLAVQSVKESDGEVRHTTTSSTRCPSVSDAIEVLSNLDLPPWEIAPPKPYTPGIELLPMPKDGPTYEAMVRVYPQDGYPTELNVSVYAGPVAAELAGVMQSLEACWSSDSIDLAHR